MGINMEFSLRATGATQKLGTASNEEANPERASLSSGLKLLKRLDPSPAPVQENPLSEILKDFRRELVKFINAEETPSTSIGFGPKPSVASLSVERLKAACKNTAQRLEDIATASDFDPAEKISAAQLEEQVEMFSAFLKGNVEQRDVQVEQVAIKMKSMVTQALVQLEAGPPPEMDMSMLQQLLAQGGAFGGTSPALPTESDESLVSDEEFEE